MFQRFFGLNYPTFRQVTSKNPCMVKFGAANVQYLKTRAACWWAVLCSLRFGKPCIHVMKHFITVFDLYSADWILSVYILKLCSSYSSTVESSSDSSSLARMVSGVNFSGTVEAESLIYGSQTYIFSGSGLGSTLIIAFQMLSGSESVYKNKTKNQNKKSRGRVCLIF